MSPRPSLRDGSSAGPCHGLLAAWAVVWTICVLVPTPVLAGQAPDFLNSPEDTPSSEKTSSPTSERGVPYEVHLEGVEDPALLAILNASSQLIAQRDNPPLTQVGLRRRVDDDIERLNTTLRSEGYYAAAITDEIDSAASPHKVTLRIASGPRYRVVAYDVTYADGTPPPEVEPGLDEIDVELGMPARAPAILAAQENLLNRLQERGYPLARVSDRKTFVDHDKSEMTVKVTVAAGPRATFGPLSFVGQEQVEEDYLRRIVDWPEGEVYDRRVLRTTQRRLSGTGLFSTVNAEATAPPAADGSLPVTITLDERERRSIGGTVFYSSDIGPGLEVFWEHRNLFDRNEKLRVSGKGSLIEQTGLLSFRKPAFLERQQDLVAELSGGFEDNDAYKREAVDSLIALERPLLENWKVSAGFATGYSFIDEGTEGGDKENFLLFGLPLVASRDVTDDPLDPASGTRLLLSMTPTTGTGDGPLLFLKTMAAGTAYYAIDEDDRFVLAGRARVGTILGEDTDSLPADRRFYAGGGGSIRGYEYQLVGPLDGDEDPFGGSSLFEVSGEIRVRLTDEFGIVPFLDGGTVYDDPWFSSGETLRWATGLGFRYFTGFGPLRLDVAFPLNPREDVDEAFQFYVSFGQAF